MIGGCLGGGAACPSSQSVCWWMNTVCCPESGPTAPAELHVDSSRCLKERGKNQSSIPDPAAPQGRPARPPPRPAHRGHGTHRPRPPPTIHVGSGLECCSVTTSQRGIALCSDIRRPHPMHHCGIRRSSSLLRVTNRNSDPGGPSGGGGVGGGVPRDACRALLVPGWLACAREAVCRRFGLLPRGGRRTRNAAASHRLCFWGSAAGMRDVELDAALYASSICPLARGVSLCGCGR